MPRRYKRKEKSISVSVRCLSCQKLFTKTAKLYPNGHEITCSGLSKHITTNKKCNAVYTRKYSSTCNRINYIDSLVMEDQHHLKKKQKVQYEVPFQRSDFALTETCNGPATCTFQRSNCKPNTKINHSRLNHQTIFSGSQPHISRENIILALGRESDIDCDVDSDIHDDSSVEPTNIFNQSSHDYSIHSHSSDSEDSKHMEEAVFTGNNTDPVTPDNNEPGDQTISMNSNINTPMSDALTVEAELINLLHGIKAPLSAYTTIMQWAKRSQGRFGFNFKNMHTITPRDNAVKNIEKHFNLTPNSEIFQQIPVQWLPDNTALEISVRPFQHALNSLLTNSHILKEENLSFPNSETPYSYENVPSVNVISELHHGKWWSDTWQKRCKANSKEILVPIILYMDGISLDAHGRLSLTPLNMTLGIFNNATRKKDYAWETIYFHPDSSYMSSRQTKKSKPIHNQQNLHMGLSVALQSFKDICESESNIVFQQLPWNGKEWVVHMKFAIAFVIGDTELHDKLTNRFGGRNDGVKYVCRHCNCPNEQLTNPVYWSTNPPKIWEPVDFKLIKNPSKDHWKNLSHHPVKNAFHDLDFGENSHNIHLATPGECLHMHQLGAAKRAIEAFGCLFKKKADDDRRAKRADGFQCMGRLAFDYGHSLSRQSERDLPNRLTFTCDLLITTKKEGKDWSGIILNLLVAIISQKGKDIMNKMALITDTQVKGQIETLEIILLMEEFLKKCNMEKRNLKNLPKFVDNFINLINKNCKRGGNGTNLIKNHLYYHLPMYINMWGPPSGWDSAPSESHHKYQIKAPSQNTQKRPATVIEQTARRSQERKSVQHAMRSIAGPDKSPPTNIKPCGGSWFDIFIDERKGPTMKWIRATNSDCSHHCKDVIDFCCNMFLKGSNSNDRLKGFTEHNRLFNGNSYKFRASPSYRSTSGQKCNVWYDWAQFQYASDGDDAEDDDDEVHTLSAPAQILCFLQLEARHYDGGAGLYAIVRSFKSPPTPLRNSRIVMAGEVDDDYYIYSCDSICDTVAVVENKQVDATTTGKKFFVVKNRQHWLQQFHQMLDEYND